MKNAPILHAIEAFAFERLRRAILRRRHEDVRAFGARFGRFAHRLLGRQRRLAEQNLERVFPDRPEAEREQIARACFEHFGGNFCEVLSLGRFDRESILSLFEIEGMEILEALVRDEDGFFLHAGHYGSWEMALYPLGAAIDGLHAVARPLDNPRIDGALRRLRERSGATLIGKVGVGRRMRTIVRGGGRVAIVIDQHVRPGAAIRVPFLGHPAWTSPLLAMLALRLQVPVLPFTCEPLPGGRYRLVFREPIRGEGRGEDAEVEMTRRILAPVEDDIRRRPELWLWMHRRWRDG